MSDSKKFLFDLHYFDDNNVMHAAEDPNAPPPAPTFNEEELEQAKKEAYEAGKKDGEEAALTSIQEKTVASVQSIQQSLSGLFDREQDRFDMLESGLINVLSKVIAKLYPSLAPTLGFAELREFLRHKLTDLRKMPHVDITLHPDMAPLVDEELSKLKDRLAAQGSWTILEDETIALAACEITWKNGGADWNPDQIYAFIEQALEPHLASIRSDLDALDQNLHDKGDISDSDPDASKGDESMLSDTKKDEEP